MRSGREAHCSLPDERLLEVRSRSGGIGLYAREPTPGRSPLGATAITTERSNLDFVTQALTERARRHADLSQQDADALAQLVRARTVDLLDEWDQIALDYDNQGVRLQYQREVGAARPLLHEFLDPELGQLPRRHWKFRANRSMRDVEPEVNLWVKALDNTELDEDDEP